MTELHVVLPNDIDDPAVPRGGTRYDRRVCAGLTTLGWTVREYAVPGAWPRAGGTERAALTRVLAALPDDALVLLDGLVASAVPDVLGAEAGRVRLVVLVHLPLEDDAEGAALGYAVAVVTTSEWSRHRLLDRYALPADRVHVATPGVDPADLAPGSADGPVDGSALLCVAAITPGKGHDRLTEALALVDLPWTCVCVGSLRRDPDFAARVLGQVGEYGLADRIHFAGPRTGPELDAAYAAADLLVLASRGETYGMAVTQAPPRGIPVLATAVKGLPEALGRAPDGTVPGRLGPPDDPAAFPRPLRARLTR